MTREDLFKAIGQVEEHRLARCDAPSGIVRLEGDDMENKTKKRPAGRMLRNVLVAAVVVALLAATAIAAPVAYEGITGAWLTEEWEWMTPTGAAGGSDPFTTQKFEVGIQLGENAPEEIETYYMPQMPEGYTQYFGNVYGGIDVRRRMQIDCYWSDDQEICAVWFSQVSKYSLDHEKPVIHLVADTAEVRQTELGGVEGILILNPDDTDDRKNHFFWTDGEYLFEMAFNAHITEEEMGKLVASVWQVEDIRPYMISADDEEILEELLNR